MKCRFSIIIATLNAGSDLQDTVENVLGQSFDDYEVIVKDGVSTDNSLASLPMNNPRLHVYSEKDRNVYDGMNQAIKHAHGEFSLFINSGDSLYSSTVLENLDSLIEKEAGDFYYGRSYTISEDVMRFGPKKMTKFFCYRSTLCHQAMVIRTRALVERGYDTSFEVSADREWMVYAFMKAKLRFVETQLIISNYKGEGISSTSDAADLISQENSKIRKTYFRKDEIALFSFLEFLTLKRIRIAINKIPIFRTIYGKLKYLILANK